jgi:hypothetical protein
VKRQLAEFDGLEIMLSKKNGEQKESKVVKKRLYNDRKDALFHFTGVFSSEDDHLHTFKVDLDGGGGAHAFGKTIGGELTGVVNDEIGFAKVGELLFCGTDEHVVHEEGMIGSSANDADFDPVFGMPL